ncbi:hypothetical protein A2U01_0005192 [Trifolium medium]|uniref:Endonuclease/exonuclease/phosphatase family protein n=1 Tax=Trifolium medium TaxID=97028 RepID=A0A392MA36_9FABA|nr:hypothetical protein [Trifolium medium]
METRLKAFEVENVRSRLGFKNCLSVDCSGNGRDRAGGLSLMWMEHEQNKRRTWQLIRSLAQQAAGSWLCVGDYNDILDPQEKQGGNARSQNQLSFGRQAIVDCSLLDLGFEGYPFTWSNGREGDDYIQYLDRIMQPSFFALKFQPNGIKGEGNRFFVLKKVGQKKAIVRT